MKAVNEMGKDLTAENSGDEMDIQTGRPKAQHGSTAGDFEVEDELDGGLDSGLDMYVKFSKPYVFEDDTYKGIDMSCLEKLNTNDLVEIEKKFYKQGVTSFNPENTATYAKIVAWKATGLPIEFFDSLPVKEMLKIKSRVVNFFYN